jgi:hypothetical protein
VRSFGHADARAAFVRVEQLPAERVAPMHARSRVVAVRRKQEQKP